MWQRLLRDVVIALALHFVKWQCWQQAQRHAPAFQMSEVHMLTGKTAGYTTVDSPEHAASPNIKTDVLRPRSAFWLRGSSGRGGSAGVARAGGAAVGSSCQSA